MAHQTDYVADQAVPPTISNDSSKGSKQGGPLWALAGVMTGEYYRRPASYGVCANVCVCVWSDPRGAWNALTPTRKKS